MEDFEKQICRLIYHRIMSIMKFTLELREQETPGDTSQERRNDRQYKFFKKLLMQTTYQNARGLFEDLHELGVVKKTDYPEDVKNGYKDNASGGSGYLNSDELDSLLDSIS